MKDTATRESTRVAVSLRVARRAAALGGFVVAAWLLGGSPSAHAEQASATPPTAPASLAGVSDLAGLTGVTGLAGVTGGLVDQVGGPVAGLAGDQPAADLAAALDEAVRLPEAAGLLPAGDPAGHPSTTPPPSRAAATPRPSPTAHAPAPAPHQAAATPRPRSVPDRAATPDLPHQSQADRAQGPTRRVPPGPAPTSPSHGTPDGTVAQTASQGVPATLTAGPHGPAVPPRGTRVLDLVNAPRGQLADEPTTSPD